MITFTIITCTYNAASVLQRTLDSVLKQSYQNVEHIILDGKSKDDTLQIAERYKQESDAVEDTRHKVIVVSEPDKGLYDAMNKGIDKATGSYIVFLNAGDVFSSEDTLETIANSVGEGEELPGVLYGETDVVNDQGEFVRHRRLQTPEKLSWRSFKWGMLVCHQAFYARTDIARENHYNLNYRLSADVDWCIRIMKAASEKHLPLCNVHAVIVNYLEGGMSIKNHKASLKERFRIMSSHYGLVQTSLIHLWFIIRSLLKK